MKKKELLFSITKKDLVIKTSRGSGPGGQHRNKRETAVTITHPPSGAKGYSCDQRSQIQNKRTAFRRMVQSKEMQLWIKRTASSSVSCEEVVKEMMQPENLRIEHWNGSAWEEVLTAYENPTKSKEIG